MVDTYIVVDIEASGWVPGEFSMLSIGACVAFDISKTFYVELKPINEKYTKEAMEVNKLSFEKLKKEGKDPKEAMAMFEQWVIKVSGKNKPIFVAFPAVFDWSFVNYYFHRFLGRNPFERRVLEMKSYFAGKLGLSLEEATRDKLFQIFPATTKHTHVALDDAIAYAESFERLLRYNNPNIMGKKIKS